MAAAASNQGQRGPRQRTPRRSSSAKTRPTANHGAYDGGHVCWSTSHGHANPNGTAISSAS
ncbi:hypothetical protein HMPREF3104_04505 [Corynebacterium sp. HMSC30G07]|nr:hypothetical protein HMPREF3104_04505 [Corynebacterium sp. HMSC30G07]